MDLSNAIRKARSKNKKCVVNDYTNNKIKTQVKPISMIEESKDHFVIDNHIQKINSMTDEDIEEINEVPNDYFIIQFVENNSNTMSDITGSEKNNVFDENIFKEVEKAEQWIQNQGYL